MFLRKDHAGKTDEELVHLYQTTRNLEWLSTVYLRYSTLIYGVCLKYLKDRDKSKDAVMQIHEKLITTLLQHEVKNFRSWLYVIARNHCLMALRSEKRQQKEEITPFIMENGIPEHLEDDGVGQNLEKLEKCIETLVEEQQLCVRLFYLQERCYREVAEATGFDANQVKSYIQNGKRNLKICMEGNV